jgi:hypothetical protein
MKFIRMSAILLTMIYISACESKNYPYFIKTGVYQKVALYSANDYLCGLNGDGTMSHASWELMVNLAVYAARGGFAITMGLMDHTGDWNPDPSALPNLKNFVETNTALKVTVADITLGQTDVSKIDLLFVTGHSFGLTDSQKQAFREYFRSYSGVMFADDCNGAESGAFTDNFKAAVAELTGAREYRQLDPGNLLFS